MLKRLIIVLGVLFVPSLSLAASYIVVNEETNEVVNVIEWDGVATYQPPANTFLVSDTTFGIGDTYIE